MGLSTPAMMCVELCFILPQNSTYATDEPSIDPCTLLTKTEAEEIVGSIKDAPSSSLEEGVRICSFEFVDKMNALELWIFQVNGARERTSIDQDAETGGRFGRGSVHDSQ